MMVRGWLVACSLVLTITTLRTAEAQPALAPGEVAAIAEEAFVYGFPLVMNYGVMYESFVDTKSLQYRCPFNQLYNTARVFTPADTAVVTPNSDTPYSFFGADLRAEPMVFSVPKMESGRYFSVQLVDWYTFNFGYVGSRTTGNEGGHFLIVGPAWTGEKPAGIDQVFRCETEFAFAIFRTQLFNPADLEKVKAIQAGYRLQPLSTFQKTPAPPAAPEVAWPKIDKNLAETNPFGFLSFLLQFCPPEGPAAVERPLRARMARIGIEAGKPFSLETLTADQQAELKTGIRNGLAKIRKQTESFGKTVNGWHVATQGIGDRAVYKGDWALRAAVAMAGIYANNPQEAVYPLLATDDAGKKPDCTTGRYTLTFPANQLPPVRAFWSVTMYDAKTQLLVDNPLNRYLINAPMLPQLKKNPDGSLTLYIQHESPGPERESNWLPAPKGPIYVAMRLYWPRPEVLEGTWQPPPLHRVP